MPLSEAQEQTLRNSVSAVQPIAALLEVISVLQQDIEGLKGELAKCIVSSPKEATDAAE